MSQRKKRLELFNPNFVKPIYLSTFCVFFKFTLKVELSKIIRKTFLETTKFIHRTFGKVQNDGLFFLLCMSKMFIRITFKQVG